MTTDERREFLDCHAMSVTVNKYGITVEWWATWRHTLSMGRRVRHAWHILRYGELVTDNVVLSPGEAMQLGRFLQDAAKMQLNEELTK